MKILIVDDNIVIRKSLQKLLTPLADCETVGDGRTALKVAICDTPPDLILLDIVMPEMNGHEVLNSLMAAQQTKDVPVIFISAMDDKEDVIKGLEMGAVDYITKPFHKAEVMARVQTHLLLKEKTEQLRQTELQLIEMDRIVGTSTLAAGMAHEINNPLGFVKSGVCQLEKDMAKMLNAVRFWDDSSAPFLEDYRQYLAEINFERLPASIERKFDRVRRGIERIIAIILSLKNISGVDKEKIGPVEINKCIEEAIDVLKSSAKPNVEIVFDPGYIPPVTAVLSEINQCLLHIIKNAQDAIKDKGTIKISTFNNAEKQSVTITVSDNGHGMSEETLRRAFHTFFTTKPVGSGTGIGLALTERIIKRHAGLINLTSEEGEGTSVSMTFPVKRDICEDQDEVLP